MSAAREDALAPAKIDKPNFAEILPFAACSDIVSDALPTARSSNMKEVADMPRMPKYLKNDWAFFLDDRGRRAYNELCRRCEHDCKQSFRAVIIQCPHYLSKRRKKR